MNSPGQRWSIPLQVVSKDVISGTLPKYFRGSVVETFAANLNLDSFGQSDEASHTEFSTRVGEDLHSGSILGEAAVRSMRIHCNTSVQYQVAPLFTVAKNFSGKIKTGQLRDFPNFAGIRCFTSRITGKY